MTSEENLLAAKADGCKWEPCEQGAICEPLAALGGAKVTAGVPRGPCHCLKRQALGNPARHRSDSGAE